MLPTTPLPEPETGTPEAEVPGVTVQYGTLVSRSGTEGRQGVWEGHWAMETPYTACFMGSTRGGCPDEGAVMGAAISPEKGGPFPSDIGIGLRSSTSVGAEACFLLGPPAPTTAGAGATSKLRRPKTNILQFRIFIKTNI